ncbi:hypothetical protein C8R46DRAFT_1206028 [Mycena filopes]|nr:hypothetical protein C8R46DRAFT_1206028 [Mycena filopes]
MLNLLPYFALLSLAAKSGADTSSFDGKHVPSTTDLPAPEITGGAADVTIQSTYGSYLEECGRSLEQAKDQAVDEYKYEFNSDPADSNSPAFITWAYTHFPNYNAQYTLCQHVESQYRALLATYSHETPSPTSHTGTSPTGTGGFSFTTSSSHSESGSSGGGGSSDGGDTNGANSVASSLIRPLLSALVVVAGYLN